MAEQSPLVRALRLLRLLDSATWRGTAELAERLDGATPRTVQRTLSSLEEAGIVLERRRVAHGAHEVRLPAALRVPPHLLSTDEALAALVLSQFGGHFAGTPVGQALDGLLDKLEQLLPCEGLVARAGLGEADHAVRVRQPGQVLEGTGLLLQVLEAILERRVCRVHYRRLDAGEAHAFEVEPYSLVFFQGAVYVLVRQPVHESWLHLALQRLESVETGPRRFQRRADFRLEDFLNGSFGIWTAPPVEVRLRFDRRLARSLRERIWHPSQRWEDLEDGGLRLVMEVGLSPELRAWVLRWGSLVEVEAPAEFRAELSRELALAAARYLRGAPQIG